MLSRKLGPPLFALVCVGMAFAHLYHPLDKTFIGLVLLAAIPWFVPWLMPLISSLKVGGLELNFRELKAQVDENKQIVQATAAAVMTGAANALAATRPAPLEARAAAADGDYVSHGIPMAPPLEEAEALVSDPNKGAFGGRPERDGFRLSAEVKPV